jgi:hypothetical protein
MSNAERVGISQRWHAYDQELTLYVLYTEQKNGIGKLSTQRRKN